MSARALCTKFKFDISVVVFFFRPFRSLGTQRAGRGREERRPLSNANERLVPNRRAGASTSGHEWTMMMMMMNNQAIKIYQYVDIYLNETWWKKRREKKMEKNKQNNSYNQRNERGHTHTHTRDRSPKKGPESINWNSIKGLVCCVFAFQNGRHTGRMSRNLKAVQ